MFRTSDILDQVKLMQHHINDDVRDMAILAEDAWRSHCDLMKARKLFCPFKPLRSKTYQAAKENMREPGNAYKTLAIEQFNGDVWDRLNNLAIKSHTRFLRRYNKTCELKRVAESNLNLALAEEDFDRIPF